MKKKLLGLGLGILLSANIAFGGDVIKVKPGAGTIYNVPYEESRLQFHEVAKTADKEDFWLQVGDKVHDIGDSEIGRTVHRKSKEKLTDLLKESHPDQKEVRAVHNHPKKITNEVHPPSPSDIYNHTILKEHLKKKLNIEVKSDVYDGFGIWTYDSTKELKEKLEEPGFFLDDGPPHLTYLSMAMGNLVEEVLQNKSLSRKEKVQRFIEGVEPLGVKLTYISLEK